MAQEVPKISKSLWIPILGYYVNLSRLSKEKRGNRIVAVYTSLLGAVIVISLLEPIGSVIPLRLAVYLTLISIAILGVAVAAIAVIETYWNTNAKNPNSRLFRGAGWDQLAGKPRRYIFTLFFFTNYHELAIGGLFCVLTFMGHAHF